MSFYDWSTTASNNGAIDAAINWAEFQDPSTVNDSARAMMARVAEWRKDVAPTRSSTGSGNAYAVTSEAGGSTAYRDGEIVTFIADRANTAGCTLNVNARGAKAFRPAIGVDFKAGEIQANQAIIAFYRSATEEFIGVGSGYHVNAMTTGLLSQSIAARLIKIGTPVLSLAPTAPAGYIRLTEATQTRNKSDWPELDTWLSSISYPWGSTSTTFNLPPAAGYVLRFAATSSSIDPDGARAAGSTQTDSLKSHVHTASVTDPGHAHTVSGIDGTFINRGELANQAARSGSTTTANATTGITVSVAATGGTETRPKNVAMHVDIFASSQLSAGTLAMFGFPYGWDTGTTGADPGSARVRGNNATLASITALYINETDAWGVDIGSVLGAITNGSVIRLSKVGAQANTLVMTVSGSITDSGTYRAIPVTVTAVNGSFSSNDSLAFELAGGAGATGATGPQGPQGAASTITIGTVTTGAAGSSASVTNVGTSSAAILDFAIPQGAKGDKGDTGDTGATGSTGPTGATGAAGADGIDSGIRWRFDTSTTTNADPGTGDFRLNNAALASVTEIAISYSANETGNPSVEAYVKAWDDSTTTGNRGQLIIKKVGAAENYAVYAITSAITDGTTYGRFTLSHVSSAGTISNTDAVSVQFSRTGDKGVDGLGAGDVVGPAASVDGEIALFDSTTGKLLKRATSTGILKSSSGVIGTATSGTDYAPATSGTSILKANGSGGFSAAVAGTDYQAADSELTAIAGLTSAADTAPYFTGIGSAALMTVTSTARNLLDDTSAGAMRTTLGLSIGTDVQAYDADLSSWAGVTRASGFDAFAATPSSANLASLVSDETGSGALVFGTSPTLTTPNLGTPSAITLTNGTDLPVSGITPSTSTAIGVGSIELGHASDTTITRTGSGAIAVEGVGVALNSTSLAHTAGTIELGHATDTTLARSSAGEVTIEGTLIKKVGKETIWIPASAMITRTTNGAASGTAEMSTNKNMFSTLDFDTTTQEFAQFEIHMPKSWNLGTVTFQPVWSHASTTTNFGVVWQLAGVARSDDDAGDVAFGTAQTSTDTGGTTNDIYIGPESSAITIAGTPAAGDTVQFQIARAPSNGSDTMAIDARLHGIRLFFTTNASTDA